MEDGKEYFRYMGRLQVEESCLKCHAFQGYKLGDVRGGISVSIPVETEMQLLHEKKDALINGHAALWLLGLAALFVGGRRQSKAAAALFDSERKSRTIIDTAPAIILVLAEDGGIVDLNHEAEKLYDCRKEDVLGKSYVEQFLPEEVREEVKGDMLKVFEGEPTRDFENVILKQDGSQRIISWNVDRLLDIHGSPKGIIAIGQDITERKKSEEALRESEHNLQQAQTIAHIGSWTYDMQGNISWSDEMYLIYGVSQDIFTPDTESINNMIHSDDLDAMKAWIAACLEGDEQGELEFRIIRSDGNIRYLRGQGELICDANGKLVHIAGTSQDITEHKLLEEQFNQAQKMEAIGTLVGGIAHDFNNMLAAMTGNLYLAKRKIHEMPDVAQNLANIENLSFRAADMIQQLLTFARKGQVSMEYFPLTPFIKETIKFLRTSTPENIKIDQHICSEPLQIKGDVTQLHQVLMNLVNNAGDAVEGMHEPCITISLESLHADDDFIKRYSYFTPSFYAHLSVKDNGCGVPDHVISHLFEPFFTTKEQGKGTGLGLAMVFGAMKTHHGFVGVESVEGEGSTFSIYLPLEESDDDLASVPDQENGVARGQGETILLVDDDLQIIETGKEVLESLGYHVLTAADGQQAVERFEAHADAIDLIVMDIIMPVLSGDKAVQLIRRIDPHAKVIFATGYDKNTQADLANETVISKPFSVVEMSHLIRNKLSA